MEHSYKYEILRHDMYIKDFPAYEPPQAQESETQPVPVPSQAQPEPPRPKFPTPRDLAPRFVAARENTDLVILKHRLEGATRSAENIARDLANIEPREDAAA